MAQKQALEDDATATQRKMDSANALINALAGEESRWTQQSKEFDDTIQRLTGGHQVQHFVSSAEAAEACGMSAVCSWSFEHIHIWQLAAKVHPSSKDVSCKCTGMAHFSGKASEQCVMGVMRQSQFACVYCKATMCNCTDTRAQQLA